MNIIDHVGLSISDYRRALRFYEQALAPLGISLVMQVKGEESGYEAAGFGRNGKPSFWLEGGGKQTTPHVHVAFLADSRAAVDAFYRAGLAAGGKDNGPPGLRAHYHPNYYGAFVLDPEGHNVEAVCHRAE